MSQLEIDYLGEGASDEAIARKLIQRLRGTPGRSYQRPLGGVGKENLDRRLAGLNRGANYGRPILVLRDLDRDADCPAELVAKLVPNRHPNLLLRICVPSADAWLVADRAAYARYCGMSSRLLPPRPEEVPQLKQIILDFAETGTARNLTRHLQERRSRGVPNWAIVGEWQSNFAEQRWDPIRAAENAECKSLSRSLARLRSIMFK